MTENGDFRFAAFSYRCITELPLHLSIDAGRGLGNFKEDTKFRRSIPAQGVNVKNFSNCYICGDGDESCKNCGY